MLTARGQSEKSSPQNVLSVSTVIVDESTDLERWRLLDEQGRHTWHYLRTDEEVEQWPQTLYDRHHLGLPINLPKYPKPNTPLEAARNALEHFSHFQLPSGHWACEFGGPMFLLPGLVITWYVTETPIPKPYSIEIKRYLYARQHPEDGGWGLHIEGKSSVFGTAMNYVVMRLLGASEEDPRMVKARACLHRLGGALYAPHWAKFWLSVLGVMDWSAVNPIPPELWLLPDWVPVAPWRWWVHMRQVFLPMSYIWSNRFSYPSTDLTKQIREELYTQPHETIAFASYRNSISPKDNYHPKSWLLNSLNWMLVHVWNPYLRTKSLVKRAEDWAFELIRREDENTAYANLAPVNATLNFLACYIHDGPDAESVQKHRSRMDDLLWMKHEGMFMNGTNGLQTWDTEFLIQAAVEAGLATEKQFVPTLTKALGFLDAHQIREDVPDMNLCYRQRRKGAWAFSERDQGYTVSDCTAEGIKSVILLQRLPEYPKLVSDQRLRDAVDTLLTMQNASGGFASYEPIRGGEYLELLNAAEVFGRIMIEYDYPECTTAVVTALQLFKTHDPDYRREDIERTLQGALRYLRHAQKPDGSWYGAWGICFTYAAMFALESLASVGETYETSARVRNACDFLLSHQRDDGGWGESYQSCELNEWVDHENTQVVQTCWALLGLMEASCPNRTAIEKGVKLVMQRQQPDGGFKQEAVEGVFNKSCMINYPNYKYYFPIKALGMFARKYGNPKISF